MVNYLSGIDKYYLFAVNNTKAILLSSSNSKTDLRKKAIEKLGKKTTNISKYDQMTLHRIKLIKTPSKEIENEAKSKIKTIGGPYCAVIEHIQIIAKNKIRFKNLDEIKRIYFSQEYVDTNLKIKSTTISYIAFEYVKGKTYKSDLFAINTINKQGKISILKK